MSTATATTDIFPLATETPYPTDESGSGDGALEDGASGPSSYDGAHISTGALVAVLVVVVVVAIIGVSTAALFLVAKRREWTVRETLRRSARRVVTALTPRARTEFPRELKDMPVHAGGTTAAPPRVRVRVREDEDGDGDVEKGLGRGKRKMGRGDVKI